MISRDRWQRLEPILDGALDLPGEQVAAYLDRECGDEPEIREQVEHLIMALRQQREGGGFLDAAPTALTGRVLGGPDLVTEPAGDPGERPTIGPYEVLRRLGGGGMGVVYLARDPRLDRLVALKLLPPWLAADEHAALRLAEEARAASALDHPNIETVFDIGHTDDDRLYVAMSYYEGETLQERIGRGPLPVDEAVALAEQIAFGLEAAHRRGIVHRDIKPANVIVTPAREAKIVDFGIAKAVGRDITEPGVTPGTVAYMSPEQTRGRNVDASADLWSLGVVLYEMLAGRRPFTAQGSDATIYAIRHDQPEPLTRLRPEVPQSLARVVDRCLAKDPRARYRDAGAVATALRHAVESGAGRWGGMRRRRVTMLAGAVLAVTLVAGVSVIWRRVRSDVASPAVGVGAAVPVSHRLAVLPLSDSRPDSEQAYFAEGLTEELITRISSVAALRATALASVMPYQNSDEGVPAIAQELGVGNLLLGRAHRVAERFHLSLRLVDAGRRELWSHEYDAAIGDVATVERNVVEQVVAALGVPLRARERRRLAGRGTENADAYTEYLRARYFLEKENSQAAKDHFERSLDLDPTFAAAWSGLSRTYIQLSIRGLLAPHDGFPRGRQAAEKALELDPNLAEARANLAAALNWYYWDTEGAERQLRLATELDPSDPWAGRAYAVHLCNLGRFAQALSAEARVRELDPLNSAGSYVEEGTILYFARQYEEAIARLRQAVQVDPTDQTGYFFVALVYAQLGRYPQALAALQQTDPHVNQPNAMGVRGYVLARLGQRDAARRMLGALGERSAAPGGAAYEAAVSFDQAVIYLGLGETDRALDLLERAAKEPAWQMRLLKVEPIFDPLRERPRFRALLERMKLTG